MDHLYSILPGSAWEDGFDVGAQQVFRRAFTRPHRISFMKMIPSVYNVMTHRDFPLRPYKPSIEMIPSVFAAGAAEILLRRYNGYYLYLSKKFSKSGMCSA
jgi:hypothetical protein